MSIKELQEEIIITVLHTESESYLREIYRVMQEAITDLRSSELEYHEADRNDSPAANGIVKADIKEAIVKSPSLTPTLKQIQEAQGTLPIEEGDYNRIVPKIDWEMSADELLKMID